MTRPTPTQGAQSEAARVPRVSESELQRLCDCAERIGSNEYRNRLALDLRDVRQASRDKDATIADLERERDYITGRRQHWEAEAGKEHARADALQARLTEAEFLRTEAEAEKDRLRGDMIKMRSDTMRARALVRAAEQRAATAERRGFEAGRDAAAEVIERKRVSADGVHEMMTGRQVRALAPPAAPQEGETTP